ncbi:hypothetical protein FRC12_017500 [Ceratobasidium sp. 428]|nr:hypothetical protein FRC12_017500 [Ceratobasidium sp. 428]
MIQRFSKQILSLIFVEGAAADWDWRRRTSNSLTRHKREFRDIVTWVCRSWRSAALSTPGIWARIDLSDPTPHPRTARYIARTGATGSVHIHLDANRRFFQNSDENDWKKRSELLRDRLGGLVQSGCETERWKSIHLNIACEVDVWATVFFLSKVAKFPNLESFTLIGHHGPGARLEERLDTATPIISDPGPADSKLRSVHFKRFSMKFLAESQLGTTVLSQLTFLELGLLDSTPSVSQICQMLGDSPNLRTFCLRLGSDPPDQEPKVTGEDDMMEVDQYVLTLPRLEEFSLIHTHSALWTYELLSALSMPSLRKLWFSVHAFCSDDMSSVAAFLAMGPAFPALRYLATNLDYEPLVIPLLHAYPRLERLMLLPGHGMGRSIALGEAPWLSPHLTHLGVSDYDRDASRVIRMACERQDYRNSIPIVVTGGANIYDCYHQ